MTSILIPNIDNKFYRNVSITNNEGIKIITQNISGGIYGLYYKYKFDTVIIPSSLLDNSIVQFSIEFRNSVKVIIDVDVDLDQEFLDTYHSIFVFILNQNNSTMYTKYKFINKPTHMINDKIYNAGKNTIKENFIACFLDDIKLLPPKLIENLYPNKKIKIRMYNNKNINHPQNLGLINELEKSAILQKAEYYLDIINGQYNIEAAISNCKIIDLNSLDMNYPIAFNAPEYTTYGNFIQDCIII